MPTPQSKLINLQKEHTTLSSTLIYVIECLECATIENVDFCEINQLQQDVINFKSELLCVKNKISSLIKQSLTM